MKHLTLIRHAKSSWDDFGTDDFDRLLNKRGEKEAPHVGQTLEREFFTRNRIPRPCQLVSSPAKRALSTARLIAWEIGYSSDRNVEEPRIYESSALTLLHPNRRFDDAFEHVMLFGHNPGLETLAQALDSSFRGDGEKFPTCGVALMELKAAKWSELDEDGATLTAFLCPKLL